MAVVRGRALAARRPGAARCFELAAGACLWLAARLAGAAEPASAGGAAPDDALLKARSFLLQRAKERYEAGRRGGDDARSQLERALDAMRLAYRLSPEPWMLFNLAQVQSQLGFCRDASELYRHFLASDPGPEAQANAERALELLGACPDSPEPSLGDGLLPALQLAPSREALPAAMATAAAPASLLESEPEAGSAAESAEAGSRAWLWAFAGVSATSAVVGAVFYGQARAAKHDLDRLRVAGPAVIETQERGETALARARAFGGLAAGFALAAGATYWFSSPPSDQRAPSPGWGTLSWAPAAGGGVASYSFEF